MPQRGPGTGAAVPAAVLLASRRRAALLALASPLLILLALAWRHLRQTLWPLQCQLADMIGHPCPFCGGTRAVQLLLEGRFASSLHHNPLVLPGMFLLACLTLYAWAARCSPKVPVIRLLGWNRIHQRLLCAAVLLVLLALVFLR